MNMVAGLGAVDFLNVEQTLLPPGDALTRDPLAVLTDLLAGLSGRMVAVHARVGVLTEVESDPRQATELLSDWERSFGLPDPCVAVNSTIAQRQAALNARIQSVGGQSEDYFIAVAAALGYEITITTFQQALYGVSRYGDPGYSVEWRFVWQVNAPSAAAFPAEYGLSVYGDPYIAYSGQQLTCVLGRLKPAHTILIMNYGED